MGLAYRILLSFFHRCRLPSLCKFLQEWCYRSKGHFWPFTANILGLLRSSGRLIPSKSSNCIVYVDNVRCCHGGEVRKGSEEPSKKVGQEQNVIWCFAKSKRDVKFCQASYMFYYTGTFTATNLVSLCATPSTKDSTLV